MARPYMSPARRKRAGMDANPMSETPMGDMATEGEAPAEASEQQAPNQPGEEEAGSVFLPPSVLGGKKWKPGDEIVLKIKAVDPETGEAEAEYAPEKGAEPQDSMAAMDERFPAADAGAKY